MAVSAQQKVMVKDAKYYRDQILENCKFLYPDQPLQIVTSTEDTVDMQVFLVNPETRERVEYWDRNTSAEPPATWDEALIATEIAVNTKLDELNVGTMKDGLRCYKAQVARTSELEIKLQKMEEDLKRSDDERKKLRATTLLYGRRSDADRRGLKEREELVTRERELEFEKQELMAKLQQAEVERASWEKNRDEKIADVKRLKAKLRERKAECDQSHNAECQRYRAEIEILQAAKLNLENDKAAMVSELEKFRDEHSELVTKPVEQLKLRLQDSECEVEQLRKQVQQVEFIKSDILSKALAMKDDLNSKIMNLQTSLKNRDREFQNVAATKFKLEKALEDAYQKTKDTAAREDNMAQRLRQVQEALGKKRREAEDQQKLVADLTEQSTRLAEHLRARETGEEALLRRLRNAESEITALKQQNHRSLTPTPPTQGLRLNTGNLTPRPPSGFSGSALGLLSPPYPTEEPSPKPDDWWNSGFGTQRSQSPVSSHSGSQGWNSSSSQQQFQSNWNPNTTSSPIWNPHFPTSSPIDVASPGPEVDDMAQAGRRPSHTDGLQAGRRPSFMPHSPAEAVVVHENMWGATTGPQRERMWMPDAHVDHVVAGAGPPRRAQTLWY